MFLYKRKNIFQQIGSAQYVRNIVNLAFKPSESISNRWSKTFLTLKYEIPQTDVSVSQKTQLLYFRFGTLKCFSFQSFNFEWGHKARETSTFKAHCKECHAESNSTISCLLNREFLNLMHDKVNEDLISVGIRVLVPTFYIEEI